MLKGILTFALGVYTGIYISQNYELPRLDDPAILLEKLKDYAERHKKE